MAMKVPESRQEMAAYYGTRALYLGAAIGDPGSTTGPPANEPAAGAGGYARMPIAWIAGTGGHIDAAEMGLDVPAGNYTHVIVATDAALGTANMFDNCAIAPVNMTQAGRLLITPVFNQT